jgi:hypothetical protein
MAKCFTTRRVALAVLALVTLLWTGAQGEIREAMFSSPISAHGTVLNVYVTYDARASGDPAQLPPAVADIQTKVLHFDAPGPSRRSIGTTAARKRRDVARPAWSYEIEGDSIPVRVDFSQLPRAPGNVTGSIPQAMITNALSLWESFLCDYGVDDSCPRSVLRLVQDSFSNLAASYPLNLYEPPGSNSTDESDLPDDGGLTDDGLVVIGWRPISGPVLGFASVLANQDTGQILDADIVMNTFDGETTFWQHDVPLGQQLITACYSFPNTLAHEIGHVYGIGHVSSPSRAIMYATDSIRSPTKNISCSDAREFNLTYVVPYALYMHDDDECIAGPMRVNSSFVYAPWQVVQTATNSESTTASTSVTTTANVTTSTTAPTTTTTVAPGSGVDVVSDETMVLILAVTVGSVVLVAFASLAFLCVGRIGIFVPDTTEEF